MWAIGTVYHNQEMKCLNKLREIGVEAFVPLGKRLTKPTRKRKPVVTTYKLFPGYIFVHLDDGFEFHQLMNIKVKFLKSIDKDGEAYITSVPFHVIGDLLERSDMEDLFTDYDKKFVRKSFGVNQLVCWKNNNSYMLGFISRSTQGKQFAYVKIAEGKELKISVAQLALL